MRATNWSSKLLKADVEDAKSDEIVSDVEMHDYATGSHRGATVVPKAENASEVEAERERIRKAEERLKAKSQ